MLCDFFKLFVMEMSDPYFNLALFGEHNKDH